MYKKYLFCQQKRATTINLHIVAANSYLKYKGYKECVIRTERLQRSRSLENVISIDEYRQMINFAKESGRDKSDRPIQSGLSNLRSLLRSSWRSMEPGDRGYWYYSNFGFCVLGTTLELAANETLDEYLQSRYLEPLGVRASLFCGNMNADELASLYNASGGEEFSASAQASLDVPTEIGQGAAYFPGGLIISAPDLAKLVAILANDGVYDGVRYLSAESVADMETSRFAIDYLADTWPFEQALVIRRQNDLMGRGTVYYHTGSAYGVHSLLSYDPNTGDGVVVLTVGAPRRVNERGLYALCADLSERLYAEMED